MLFPHGCTCTVWHILPTKKHNVLNTRARAAFYFPASVFYVLALLLCLIHFSHTQWLQLVSKRVRSTVVGGTPAGSWGGGAKDEEEDSESMGGPPYDGDEGGGQNNRRAASGNGPPPSAVETSAVASSGGNDTQAAAPAAGRRNDRSPAAPTGERVAGTVVGGSGGGGEGEARSETAASKAQEGGKVEAELRQRLIAAMGKSKLRGLKKWGNAGSSGSPPA